jgi:predicted small metal-binding protein
MQKEIRCGDLMPGCSTVIKGKDDNEVVAKAAEHAKRDHGIEAVTPELEQKVRGAIHDAP